jgi:hypothetical protein
MAGKKDMNNPSVLQTYDLCIATTHTAEPSIYYWKINGEELTYKHSRKNAAKKQVTDRVEYKTKRLIIQGKPMFDYLFPF